MSNTQSGDERRRKRSGSRPLPTYTRCSTEKRIRSAGPTKNVFLFRTDNMCYNKKNSGYHRRLGHNPNLPRRERTNMKEPKAMAYVNMYGVLGALENLCSLDDPARKFSGPQKACEPVLPSQGRPLLHLPLHPGGLPHDGGRRRLHLQNEFFLPGKIQCPSLMRTSRACLGRIRCSFSPSSWVPSPS